MDRPLCQVRGTISRCLLAQRWSAWARAQDCRIEDRDLRRISSSRQNCRAVGLLQPGRSPNEPAVRRRAQHAVQSRTQLVRLFGLPASQPLQDHIKDWTKNNRCLCSPIWARYHNFDSGLSTFSSNSGTFRASRPLKMASGIGLTGLLSLRST